jgi:hypothetical protein
VVILGAHTAVNVAGKKMTVIAAMTCIDAPSFAVEIATSLESLAIWSINSLSRRLSSAIEWLCSAIFCDDLAISMPVDVSLDEIRQ